MYYFFLLSLIIISPLEVSAQIKDSLTLAGTISLETGTSYRYKIVLGEHAGKWQGYSLLDENGPNETKTALIANIIVGKKSLAFTERMLIYSKSKEQRFCYIAGMLKMQEKKKELKGYFVGQDEQKKLCGNGTIQFSLSPNIEMLLKTPQKDTAPKTAIITNQISEKILSKSKELILEFWDGGLEDSDSISIKVNNQIIEPAISIRREKQQIKIKLQSGENIINITALNEGIEPPNSARFSIIDLERKHLVVSFLRKGESAQIKIKVKPQNS